MIWFTLPTASVSACPVSSDPENWRPVHSDVKVRSESIREVNLEFETDAPERNTRYSVTLVEEDVVSLLESIAENMPGLTETFAKCLSRIIEKNVERVGSIAELLKAQKVGGYQKTAVEALLRDVKPEKP